MQPDSPTLLVSIREAARLLGISFWTAYRLAEQDQLPSVKLGRRRMVRRTALEKICQEGLPSLSAARPEADAA
jgi:excisionase family DNA binding protein